MSLLAFIIFAFLIIIFWISGAIAAGYNRYNIAVVSLIGLFVTILYGLLEIVVVFNEDPIMSTKVEDYCHIKYHKLPDDKINMYCWHNDKYVNLNYKFDGFYPEGRLVRKITTTESYTFLSDYEKVHTEYMVVKEK